MKQYDPRHEKKLINRMVCNGKFNKIKVTDQSQLKITFNALRQKDPNGFFELSEWYLLYYNGKQLTAYTLGD